jgi:hypothetical protein
LDWSNLSFGKSLRGAGRGRCIAESSVSNKKGKRERDDVRGTERSDQRAERRRTGGNTYTIHAGIRRSKREDKRVQLVHILFFLQYCRNKNEKIVRVLVRVCYVG